ncbi:LacI family DNA-binding transcriptional regulator [Saccharopolyspora erythraea]|uniref:LacI family DNA-binding transcriptional regulator n=1 Tax=Saccharopolyspora erythraea TaxID=1836 RepID=UPI001BA56C41|nr:LacI family DNA-binding transcriptional regulator [Saccharopolyspora erythraea]QUH03904.1 LacI family DNA-binding transcriptional regulator [Saccharopolyspora erythraea]
MASTLADVAARAGVSTATVSRVLNGNYPVSAATRERVHRAVEELSYVGNAPARALAAHSSDVIGVIVSDVSDPFFGIQASGLQWEAADSGLLAVICNTAGSPAAELKYLRLLLGQRMRAIVLTGGGSDEPEHLDATAALIGQAQSAGTAVVLCGRPAPPGVEAPVIAYDNRGGAQALTRHVLAMGHRRIAYVAGPPGHGTTRSRLDGHRGALANAGLGDGATPVVHGDFSRASGFDAALELMRVASGSTAVVVANDLMALGVIAALRQHGVAVPEDVSVAGFDDLPAAVDAVPALTTVRLPLREGARRAGRIAAGAEPLTAPGRILWMPAELLARESVAPPGAGLPQWAPR